MLGHPKTRETDKVTHPVMSESEMGNQQERLVAAARLAMLFDTDGFITMRVVQRGKQRAYNVRPDCGAVNTSHALIEWAVAALRSLGVPCHVTYVDYSKWNPNRQPQWRLLVTGLKRVLRLLPHIRPYLVVKTQQADLLAEFIASRLSKPLKSLYSDRELEIANAVRGLNCNKGGAWRPVSSESIRQAVELREQLNEKMCSDLRRDAQRAAEMSVPVS